MKKIFLFIVSSVFLFSNTNAQTDTKLHFGLKIAPSLAWLTTDSKGLTNDGSKLGFAYGLITEFKFAQHYYFATGLEVAYRGGKLKYDVPSISSSEMKLTMEYIELPLTLKLKTNEIGNFTYYLQFGIAPGVNIRSREDLHVFNSIGTTFDTTNVDFMDKTNNINLSMIIGGGLEFTLSGSTVLLGGLQFSNGFLDVIDGDDLKANSNYLGLVIGFLF